MYKVGMWKKLVALSMIALLGVSAVISSAMMAGHQPKVVAYEQSIEQLQEEVLQELRAVGRDGLGFQRNLRITSPEEIQHAERILDATDDVLDLFFEDPQAALDSLEDIWTENEFDLFASVLEELFADDIYESESSVNARFWNNRVSIRIFVGISLGVFVGTITTLVLKAQIMALATQVFGLATAMAGPIGFAVGIAIGATIGAMLTNLVNTIVRRMGIGSFEWDLFNFRLWILNIRASFAINITSLFIARLNIAGGRFIPGTNIPPAGTQPLIVR